MIHWNKVVFVVSILAAASILNAGQVHASGVTVSPTFLRLSVSADQEKSSDSVAIKNNGTDEVSYKASIVDVDTETGTLLPLNSTEDLTTKVFKLSLTEFSLQPEQSINLTVTAQNLEELSPGGHYAALHIQQLANINEAGAVPINQVIGVGLFLVKEDGAIRDLSFALSDQKRFWFTMPKSQKITVKNNGNVDVVPRGFVAVERGVKTYQKVMFNETSQPVFPYQSKEYTLEFGSINTVWPGRYTESVSLRYDGQTEQQIIYRTVWYLPIWAFVVICSFAATAFIVGKKILTRRKKSSAKKKSKTTEPNSQLPNNLIVDVRPVKPSSRKVQK